MLVALQGETPALEGVGPLYPPAPALAAEPLLPLEQTPAAPGPPALVASPPGTFGGVLGAASGCAAGAGLPAAVVGSGSGILYWLFQGAAAGTIVGWTPACAALGTSFGIASSLLALPLLGSGAATAGAMIGAQGDGRDPLPALYGGLPGIGLAGISTALSCSAVLVGCGGLGAAQPVAFLLLASVLTGAVAPPCAACGAGVADLLWGAPLLAKAEEPPASENETALPIDAAQSRGPAIAMRF